MDTLQTVLFILQVIVAIALIGFILMQHGKGADAGAAFGSGASSTVFGARGSGGFLVKATTILALIFLSNSLFLGYLSSHNKTVPQSIMDSEPVSQDKLMGEIPASDTGNSSATTDVSTEPAQDNTSDVPASDVPQIPEQ